jgi:hypothetical protein
LGSRFEGVDERAHGGGFLDARRCCTNQFQAGPKDLMHVLVSDRDGPRGTSLVHPVEDVAAEDHFGVLGVRISRSKPVADHRFVSEEGILDFALPVISDLRFPALATDLC